MRRYPDLPPDAPTGEDLLDRTRPPIRIWIPSPCLVLGASQEPERELRLSEVEADGMPVYKRQGGGGAVLLGPGCLCLALRFTRKKGDGLHAYLDRGAGVIIRAAAAMGVDLRARGLSDLAYGDRKVAGCSLYLPRDFALYLASVLVDPDLPAIERYLAQPSREPDYRAGRKHEDFLVGLKALAGATAAEDLRENLLREAENEHSSLDWELCLQKP